MGKTPSAISKFFSIQGKRSAELLTPEQRHQRAKRAVETRWNRERARRALEAATAEILTANPEMTLDEASHMAQKCNPGLPSQSISATPALVVTLHPVLTAKTLSRGLGDLPPSMTPPDLRAGEAYHAQRIQCGQALGGQAPAETPLAAAGTPGQALVHFGLAAMALLEAAGVHYYYEPNPGGVERASFTMPDGQVFDVWVKRR